MSKKVRILQVAGEPGIGKTSLLEAYAAEAEELGLRWGSGRASGLEPDLPFGVVVDALDDRVAELAAVDRPVLVESEPELRRVFPALWRLGGDVPAPAPSGSRLHLAMRELLEEVGRQATLVLCFDEVHQADPASVDLLTHLVRRPLRSAVTLVLAYRPRQLPVRLAAALATAERVGLSRRVELGPLSRAEAAVLLGRDVTSRRLESAYRLAGGNPLYLRAVRDVGTLDGSDGPAVIDTDTALPRTVMVALLAEVDALGDLARTVARAAAVVGDPVPPAFVAAAADLDEDTVLEVLDELEGSDLIRPGPGGTVTFRHPVVRQVLYRSIPVGWRRAAHGRVAAALERVAAGPVQRAPHIQSSASPGEDASIDLLMDAADGVRRRAPATATRWYRSALDLTTDVVDPRRLVLLRRLVDSLGVFGRYEVGRDALLDVLRLLPPDDAVRPAAARRVAMLSRHLGRRREALDLLEAELGTHRTSSPGRTGLLLELGHLQIADDPHGPGRDTVRLAYDQAVRQQDRPHVAMAASTLALTEAMAGGIAGARRELAAATAAVDLLTGPEQAAHIELFVSLAAAATKLGHYQGAVDRLEQGLELARLTGQDYVRVPLLTMLSYAQLRLGRLGSAEEHARLALDASMASGADRHRMMALVQQSVVASGAGDLARAARLGERATALAGRFEDRWSLAAPRALAEAWLLNGRVEAGTALLMETHGGELLSKLDEPNKPLVYWTLARGSRLRGDHTRAAYWAGRAVECAAWVDLSGVRGYAHLALAEASAEADPDRALDQAGKATEEFRAGGERLNVARAEQFGAAMHHSLGNEVAARAAVNRAVAIYLACGAQPPAVLPVQLTSDAGIVLPDADIVLPDAGPPRGPGDAILSFDQLPPRQRQVARLIADGHSNREIAGRLKVVERTVEAHVSQILRRLDVGSRAAIASWVARETYGR